MCAFHQSVLFPQFKFMQLTDKRGSNTPIFQARLLIVRYFLLMDDLRNIQDD